MNARFLAVLLAAAGTASAAIAPPSGIAPTIAATAEEEAAFALRAEGTHAFECKPLASDPNRLAWAFSSQNVTLSDASGPVARQVSENTWEAISDRSSVSGAIRSRQDAGANLPWLMYRVQSTPDAGLFAGVTSVQRVNTLGGVAPADGCDASNVGKEARVVVAADYYFYRRRG